MLNLALIISNHCTTSTTSRYIVHHSHTDKMFIHALTTTLHVSARAGPKSQLGN